MPHHQREDIGIEHALDGNAFGIRVQPGHAANSLDQGFAMVGAGAADERAINIEEDQSSVHQPGSAIGRWLGLRRMPGRFFLPLLQLLLLLGMLLR